MGIAAMLNYRAEEDKEANSTVSARVMSIFIATRDEAQARALALVEGGGTGPYIHPQCFVPMQNQTSKPTASFVAVKDIRCTSFPSPHKNRFRNLDFCAYISLPSKWKY